MTVSQSAPPPEHTALLLGATGLVGGELLQLLLRDPACRHVTALVRRPLPFSHEKLQVRLVDFDRLDEVADAFSADWVFCCLGTTIRKAGSQAAFARVDLDYPLAAARLAALGGARSYHVVSAIQADAKSRVFYSRTKGQMEDESAKLPLNELHVYRPSLLLGPREEFRFGEQAASWLMRGLSFLFKRGPLAPYRAIPGEEVAQAMLAAALGLAERTSPPHDAPCVHEGQELFRLAALYTAHADKDRSRKEARPS
ncbi:NAD(P)H-binding protein [Gorillibacterium sp. CAU 1737]|uniref:NAD(P)H-binding protein n=1 Tax=Gorillibacterium sp. CAU 1737 TaxID=3140362 RepID=UPI00326169FA